MKSSNNIHKGMEAACCSSSSFASYIAVMSHKYFLAFWRLFDGKCVVSLSIIKSRLCRLLDVFFCQSLMKSRGLLSCAIKGNFLTGYP